MSKISGNQVILVVDDAINTQEILRRNLESKGFGVIVCSSVPDAVDILGHSRIALVITDLKMPGGSGMDLIRHVRENYSDTEVIMITGFPTVKGAVEALKTGAEEFLAKPFTAEELFQAVGSALNKLKIKMAGRVKTAGLEFHDIIGKSDVIKSIFKIIKRAADTPATVLISGESGTGKELVARAIHYNSKRSAAPFVPINCGGIPENLLESELFGYIKGAFTGAFESRAGFFQTAEGGTIFLDEIGEMPFSMQVKLLRVLQDKLIFMVGGRKPLKIDVRIIAASNKDLAALVKKGVFREDLYFRINVIDIEVPPLRKRGDDIILLTHCFADKFAAEMKVKTPKFSEKVLSAFMKYDWPGNVRELENMVNKLIILNDSGTIDIPDLPASMRFTAALNRYNVERSLQEVETDHINRVVQFTKGNKTKAAEILGITRKTLREKISKSKDNTE